MSESFTFSSPVEIVREILAANSGKELERETVRGLLAIVQSADLLRSAVEVVERDGVRRVEAPSGLFAHQVIGGTGAFHVVLDGFCNCPSFRQYVLPGKHEQCMCKHMLAMEIAVATGRLRTQRVPEDAIVELIAGM